MQGDGELQDWLHHEPPLYYCTMNSMISYPVYCSGNS